MLSIVYHNKFKKDYKLAIKRGLDKNKLIEVIELLANQLDLPTKYRDHQLTDSKDFKGVRELHIQPDWLLVYKIDNKRLILELIRTGTHSDIFAK